MRAGERYAATRRSVKKDIGLRTMLLATDYDLVWQVPAVRPLLPLLTSTIKASGSYEGASVLDLACGTGIGLRLLKSLGASKLVGVDISPGMLEIAKVTVPDITVHAADCSKPLDHLGLEPASFDVVLGFWLLNYCPSSVEIYGMWTNIARYLKPVERCACCGQDWTLHQADDFPAYIAIFISGHLLAPVLIAAGSRELLPMGWLALIAVVGALLLTIVMLQPAKGAVIALQYHWRMHGFDS